jgi:hypothetical protein
MAPPEPSAVGPELTFILEWAGPVVQQAFALALLSEGLAMLKSKSAPVSGLGFTSTCSCCLTWMAYGVAIGSPSIWVPNFAGFVIGTITTLIFLSYTDQPMGATLLIMLACGAAVLALMFGDVLPADEAQQWTANIGIVQAVVMLGSGAVVWPTVLREGNSSSLSLPVSLAGIGQGGCWAAFGLLVLHDSNIYGPNLVGMAFNLVNLALCAYFPSGVPGKAAKA